MSIKIQGTSIERSISLFRSMGGITWMVSENSMNYLRNTESPLFFLARKKSQHVMPLVRSDNDIPSILHEEYKEMGNIFETFVKFSENIHCMRATEMNLKIKYHEENDTAKHNLFLANEAQLAKLLLSKKDDIIELR